MRKTYRFGILYLLLPLVLCSIAFAQDEEQAHRVEVTAPRVANHFPSITYASPVSLLRYEPRVDLQSRSFSEAQGDIAVRGGIFENTGVRLGAATLLDPQTGHYFAELPVSPYMLELPEVILSSENAIVGFNSSVATVSYGWGTIEDNLAARVIVGDHSTNVQQGYIAVSEIFGEGTPLSLDLDGSRSESDGTRKGADSDFERFSGRLQLLFDDSQTDLFFGLQKKDFRWPNLYALQELHDLVDSSGLESEDLDTRLVFLNHRHDYSVDGSIELSAYYRKHKDDYEFDVFQPGLFNDFRHETEVLSLAADGLHDFDLLALRYSGQFAADEIESTALTFGDFDSRSAYKLSVAPEKEFKISDQYLLLTRAGLAYDDSNRDDDRVSPLARVAITRLSSPKSFQTLYFDFSQATQVPGYTAIGSNSEGGLFRGNQDLVRERSQNYEVGLELQEGEIRSETALFFRRDVNLVDWTFSSAAPSFAGRTAENVDIDTFGVETLLYYESDMIDVVGSYTFLNKSEDYGEAEVDASFYALNFPNHRATLAINFTPCESIEILMDNEWRSQEDNPLRDGDDDAFFSAISAAYLPHFAPGLRLGITVDNLWNENFEEVPGVPGARRLAGIFAQYEM